VNSYGGGNTYVRMQAPREAQVARPAESRSQVKTLPASTYTPEEARMAEQYARDAMADAEPELAHRRWPN